MQRNFTFVLLSGCALLCMLFPYRTHAQPFVDGCFSTPSVGTSFASNANVYCNNADLLSWNGSAWTGGWGGANINLNPSAAAGTRAIWAGDGTVWTTGGEGFGLRLSSALVSGTTYTFAFRRASHGTGQNGNFQPAMYSNTSGGFGTLIGNIPGVGTSWTTTNISFTATGANNGHTWLYFHNSVGSGMFLGCTVILPMAFKDLAAYQQAERVHVEWHVQDEPDYVWHVVERSLDGENFEETGRVASVHALSEGHDYRYADETALSLPGNMRYYRIRSINQEGLEAISPVAAVQLGSRDNFHVQLFPQPAQAESAIQASFYAPAEGAASYMVFDLSGRQIGQGQWEVAEGKNTHAISTANFAAGTYLLEVRTHTASARTKFNVVR
jgi:hypothetical protein